MYTGSSSEQSQRQRHHCELQRLRERKMTDIIIGSRGNSFAQCSLILRKTDCKAVVLATCSQQLVPVTPDDCHAINANLPLSALQTNKESGYIHIPSLPTPPLLPPLFLFSLPSPSSFSSSSPSFSSSSSSSSSFSSPLLPPLSIYIPFFWAKYIILFQIFSLKLFLINLENATASSGKRRVSSTYIYRYV